MKRLIVIVVLNICFIKLSGQSNNYPTLGDVTIYNYSPTVILQRNTNLGGFTEGIQTRLQDGTNNWYFGALHSGHWIVSKGDYQGIKFSILDNGNVGIGTTSPISPLEVIGEVRANSFVGSGYPYSTNLGSGADVTNTHIVAGSTSGLKSWIDIFGGNNAYPNLVTFGTASIERMRITADGNVGIGTPAPGNYRLNVFGKIRADEVVVNTTGADYVFDPDYKLTELSEIEAYIKQNKHLPEVTSASQMRIEGISLSEMNTLLLKKIEEMTLYMITQDKKIKTLEREMKTIKNH